MRNYDAEKLKEEYSLKGKTGLDEAKKLDSQAKLPAIIFAYTFGIIGALIFGTGMCLAMEVIGAENNLKILGIIIGVVGAIIVGVNYPIYAQILKSRKQKYSSAILLALSKDEQ